MAREEIPLSPEQVPEQARMYMTALQPHHDHPFVQKHFFQVTCLKLVDPKRGQADFFVLEFRVGQKAALIWTDWHGDWWAGQWLEISHASGDLTCPPSPLTMAYFYVAPPELSLTDAIEALAASMPG